MTAGSLSPNQERGVVSNYKPLEIGGHLHKEECKKILEDTLSYLLQQLEREREKHVVEVLYEHAHRAFCR